MAVVEQVLKAPFPYAGGKSRVAREVWARLGDVRVYVEPFAGSLAVLLARPHEPNIETVNDLDGFIANFWRALQHDPDGVAQYADYPVSELDLHARHQWLVNQHDFIETMRSDPDFYDVKIAGWWVWGISLWIGDGWCRNGYSKQLPHLGNEGRGVHRKLPHLSNAGQGVHRQLPHLGDAGAGLVEYMQALAHRLRRVRVCCGDWKRVCGFSGTTHIGLTGVFLDPPYGKTSGRKDGGYAAETHDVTGECYEWCVANQDNPKMRIALCGFEGEYDLPGWECFAWKRPGGYASRNKNGNPNKTRERIWFSPYCIKDGGLFDDN